MSDEAPAGRDPFSRYRDQLSAVGFRPTSARGQNFLLDPTLHRWIAEQVGPTLRERGLIFVGLDVIGDYLTEINVTSPTCIRELDRAFGCNIAGWLFDAIESRLNG